VPSATRPVATGEGGSGGVRAANKDNRNFPFMAEADVLCLAILQRAGPVQICCACR